MLEKCPHCGSEVLFINDNCPSCQKPSATGERLAVVREQVTESSRPARTFQSPPKLPVRQTNHAKKIPKYILIAALLFAFATIPLHWIQGAIERGRIQNRPPGIQIGRVDGRNAAGEHSISEGATALLSPHKVEILDGSYVWRVFRWGFQQGDVSGNTWFGAMLSRQGLSESFVIFFDLCNPTPFAVFCLLLIASWVSRMFTQKWRVS